MEDSLGKFQSIFTKKKQIWASETVFLPAPGCQQHPNFIGDPAAGSSGSWHCVTRPISVPLSVQHRGPRQRLLPAEPRKRPWRGAGPAETPAARAGAPSPVSLRGCFAPHGCLLEQGQRVPLLHPPQLLLLRPFELQRVPDLWEEGRGGFQAQTPCRGEPGGTGTARLPASHPCGTAGARPLGTCCGMGSSSSCCC